MRGPAFGSVHLETDWPATVQRHPTAPAATSDGHRSLIATDSDSNDETSSAREDSCVPALPSIDWFWVELWRGGGVGGGAEESLMESSIGTLSVRC